VSLHRDLELRPFTDPGDPDDWRPASDWALVGDPAADMAVIVEQVGVGDAIPLHRHRIDEVILDVSGDAEARDGDARYEVRGGDIVVIPAGSVHGTRNTGREVVKLHAVFPRARIDIEYIDRNPAPGTEDDPRAAVAWDTRTGTVEPLAEAGA
jgi:mannose-6-phosphate isomerase-like protein (cupin superfamily)